MARRLIVRGGTVFGPGGTRRADVMVEGERIVAVGELASPGVGDRVVDAGGLWVLPGLIDAHVHFNDPGRDHWEGWETGTAAAAAGGVTTVVDMPIDSDPPTITGAAVRAKLDAANGRAVVDYALWGGLTPDNIDRVGELVDCGVVGLKSFACPSGWDDFRPVGIDDLDAGLAVAGRARIPLALHCEDSTLFVDRAGLRPSQQRPPDSETAAVQMLCRLGRAHRAAVHVVHVSSAEAAAAAADYAGATVETCPHYLLHAEADGTEPDDTLLRCRPPIRDEEHRRALWRAVDSGLITSVASDHSPCLPEMKKADPPWYGVASLGLSLPLLVSAPELSGRPEMVVRLLTAARSFLALPGKGELRPGAAADIVLVEPDAEWTVDAAAVHHRHPATNPYLGRTLRSRVRTTFLRGAAVYDCETGLSPGQGRWIRRASNPNTS
jgi:allantoinase